jgi:succinate dehydrogenase / fumarate reductase iron-sulfur subunit
MRIVLRIQRYDPHTGAETHDVDYAVDAERTDRVLDVLIRVKEEQDGSLSFRRSCGHGVCGSDAMIIAGKERLACKTLVRDVAAEEGDIVTVQPLRWFHVQRDLMVDQATFFEKYRLVRPFFINDEPVGSAERIQSQEQRSALDDTTSCILCGSCYSSCPVLRTNSAYIGPASLVQAARFMFDSRDRGISQRVALLDTPDGVWACDNHFNCTRVCPREIKITKNINAMKRAITKFKEGAS